MMSWNSVLTLLVIAALFVYFGRKLMSPRDLLLVAGAAGSVGFLIAGVFHTWALLVGLAILVANSFYLVYAYRHRHEGLLAGIFPVYLRVQTQTAIVIGIALIVFVVFAVGQGRRNVVALSEYIEIYEPHSSVEWVPRVSNEVIGNWLLRTADPESSVIDYYEQNAARDGWRVSDRASPGFLVLRRDGIELTIMTQRSDAGETVVLITLANSDSQ